MAIDYEKLNAYAKRYARKGRANRFVWGPGEVEIYHSHEEALEARERHEKLLAEALAEAEAKARDSVGP